MLLESSALRELSAFLPQTLDPKPLPTLLKLFAGRPAEPLGAGSALFWQGDEATEVFEIAEGALRIVRVLGDGRRVVTGFLFPGDLVGASAGERYHDSAEAIVPTRVRRCSRRRFADDIGGCPDMHRQLLAQLYREITAARDQVVLLARKTAEERVSSFLLSLVRRTGGTGAPASVVHLPMSRLDIADYLGLTIETVSRAMTHLRALGVIVQIGRHTIVIRRPRRLAALAADDRNDMDDEMSLCPN